MDPLLPSLVELALSHGLRDVYAFGSRAKQAWARVTGQPCPGPEPPPGSDLDVGVQPFRGVELSPRARVRLALDLEDLFGVPRVDLVLLGEANAFLAAEVVAGELLHTSDPLAQAEHELYVLRRAADLAPLRRERVRAILHEGAR